MPISNRPSASAATPRRRRTTPSALIAGGIVMALAGALGLMVAAAYAPTLSNALTHEWVLKPAAYVLLRLISFASIGAGLILVIVAVMRQEHESDRTPEQSP